MTVATRFEEYRRRGGPKAQELLAVQESWIGEALRSKRLFEDLASAEKGIVQDYAGRFAIELIQNAVDAIRKGAGPDGRVAFELLEGNPSGAVLLVANDGAPFTSLELEAICRLGRTSKEPGEAIGHKGLGFKSVLEITDEPWIFSGGYAFRFGRREAAEALRQRGGPDVASGSGVQALRIPFLASTDDLPASEADAVRRLLDDECFPTVIRLPLRSQDLLSAVAARLRAIDARTLLFLDHLSCIRVTDGTGRREWSRERGAGWEELRVDGVTVSRWIVRSHVVEPPRDLLESLRDESWLAVRRVRTAVALPISERDLPLAEQSEPLFIYLPTEATSGFPFAIHGDFYPEPSRKGALDCPYNDWLIAEAVRFLAGAVLPELCKRWPGEPGVTRWFMALSPAMGGGGERIHRALTEALRDAPFVALDVGGFTTPSGALLGPSGAPPQALRDLLRTDGPESAARLVAMELDEDPALRAGLAGLGTPGMGAKLAIGAIQRRLRAGAATRPPLEFLAAWELGSPDRAALRAHLLDMDWVPCLGGYLTAPSMGVFFPRERGEAADPPLFLPIRIADVELGGPEDDVRALLAALRVREFSYREILLKVVLPAASDDVDPLPEDRLFEVYRYLRSYRSVARSGDKDVDAHARSVHVFCQAADGGPRERRPAGAVYFGRAWTGDADIETAMGGPGETRFLAPVPEFLGEDADGWREFFTWLGVARAPRVVAGSRVSLSLAHQRPDAALFGAWGYEEWLESLGSQRSCSMQHDEDTFVSARLDGLGELILAQDPARSLAYFRLLATHWASYAAALVCEVRCNHGWHRGGSETRRVESYLSWVLRHAPWLPTRWNGRVGPVSPARAIWSIRDPFVGQRVRAFLLALPPEAEGELCEALRAYLRLADPSSATVQEWLDLMAEIPRRIPAEALSEPAVADQATSVFRWAAKHLDEALKRSSAGRPADLGGGIELPARTVDGVRYHSPSEVLFADDPDLQSRWRDACAFVEMDDDLALARSRLGIRAVSQAVTIEPAFEGASAAAAASEFALLSSVLPDFLALVATTRPSTIDRIVPRIRRLRLIVVQTIRLRQRLVGTDLEPRDELEHVHLTRETEVLLGAVEAVRGTLYVTEPPIASRDEYAEELARFVELPQMGDTLAILLSATPERRAHLLERRGVTPDLLEAMRRRLEQPEDAEDALLATLRARLQQEVRSSPPNPAGLGAPTPGAPDQVHTSSLTAPPGMVAPGTPDGQEQVPPPAEPGLPALDLDQLTCTDYAPTGQVGAEDGGAHRPGGGGGPTFSLARQIGMDARKVRDGRRGEEAVLAMERLRLQRAGRPDLADAVVHRADKSAYADRDIESFEVDGTPILIEVKSTADDHMAACFISVAELRQARDLGDRYYLYRVWRVREALPVIDRIKNPVKLLLDGRIGIDFGDLVIRFPELESGE